MPGRLQLKQSGQRGENKGGICLHPGLRRGPTRPRSWPGGPHPKSFSLFPVQSLESPILGALSFVSLPNYRHPQEGSPMTKLSTPPGKGIF